MQGICNEAKDILQSNSIMNKVCTLKRMQLCFLNNSIMMLYKHKQDFISKSIIIHYVVCDYGYCTSLRYVVKFVFFFECRKLLINKLLLIIQRIF